MGRITEVTNTIAKTTWCAEKMTTYLGVAVLMLAAACGKGEVPAPPLPSATYSHPLVREVVEWDEYPGRLQSPDIVTVAARVGGVIEQAPFDEGALVKAGDLLFVLDARPFTAELKSREADLARAQAGLVQADALLRRFDQLKGTRAISEQDYDQAFAGQRQAKAAVAVAESARDIAKLNLEWTRVTAPIAGRVSRKLVTVGNLITGGTAQATPLTTIVATDPIYCYVTVPERALVVYQERGTLSTTKRVPAFVKLGSENAFTTAGTVDFVDNRVDPGTGTVQVRAVFANRDERLTPGLFARLRIPGAGPYKAILVPDRAVGRVQESKSLLVINAEGLVEQRTVTTGALFGPLRSIVSGISPEDRVITVGIQQLKPGSKVEPKEVPIDDAPLVEYQPASLAPAAQTITNKPVAH